MRKRVLGSLLVPVVLSVGVCALPPHPAPNIVAEVTRVVDGDTIDVRLLSVGEGVSDPALVVGAMMRVRYLSVNTPETEHPGMPVECFGPEAKEFNTILVAGRTVYLELDRQVWDTSYPGTPRLLAYVYLDLYGHGMVNLIMVFLGYGLADIRTPNTRYTLAFEAAEREAKGQCLGLWNKCKSFIFSPRRTCEDCRQVLRLTSAKEFEKQVHGVGETIAGTLVQSLASPSFSTMACTRTSLIDWIARQSKINERLARVIVWTFCPWLFCEDCGL